MLRWLLPALLVAALAGALVLARFGLLAPTARPQERQPATRPPAGGPLLVLASGTSLTARGDWTALLAAGLSACRGAPVRIEKLARPGATSRWGEGALLARLASGPSPDLVLIEFSINDSVFARLVSLAESRRRITTMVEAVQAKGAVPLLVTMTPAHGFERIERPFLPAYRALYGEIASATGAGLIDSLAAWEALPAGELAELVPDGVHPTPRAMADLLVPTLFARLSPLVCEGRVAPQ